MSELQVDVEGRTLKHQQPREGALPAHRHDQGRGAQLLRAGLAGAPARTCTDRAVTRIRWPHGVEDMSFFEKNAPGGTPSWVRTAKVPTTGSRAGKQDGTLVFPISTTSPRSPGWPTWPPSSCTSTSGRSTQRAARATPTGSSSTSTPASPPGSTSAPRWRCWCATRWPSATSSATPGHQRQQGPAPLRRRCRRRQPRQRRHDGAGQGGRRGAAEGAPDAGDGDHDQGQAAGQGVPRLVAELRLQDHDLAVLPARARAADRRRRR